MVTLQMAAGDTSGGSSHIRVVISPSSNTGGRGYSSTSNVITVSIHQWTLPCMMALTWGWTVEDTAVRLIEETSKARKNGERYGLITAQNALAAVQRRQRSRA